MMSKANDVFRGLEVRGQSENGWKSNCVRLAKDVQNNSKRLFGLKKITMKKNKEKGSRHFMQEGWN